jgi:hypothetical protein
VRLGLEFADSDSEGVRTMSKLYSSVQIGAAHLDHRIVQAPFRSAW